MLISQSWVDCPTMDVDTQTKRNDYSTSGCTYQKREMDAGQETEQVSTKYLLFFLGINCLIIMKVSSRLFSFAKEA